MSVRIDYGIAGIIGPSFTNTSVIDNGHATTVNLSENSAYVITRNNGDAITLDMPDAVNNNLREGQAIKIKNLSGTLDAGGAVIAGTTSTITIVPAGATAMDHIDLSADNVLLNTRLDTVELMWFGTATGWIAIGQ